MAYASNNLSVLAYANGFTLWHYKTTDKHDFVQDHGYFSKANNMLRVGDMILATMEDGKFFSVYVVVLNDGSDIAIAPIGAANGDANG